MATVLEVQSVRQIRQIRAAAVIAAKSQTMAGASFTGSEVETACWSAHDAAVATLLQLILSDEGLRAPDTAGAGIGCFGIGCFGIGCFGIGCFGIGCFGIGCFGIGCFGIGCFGAVLT